MRKNLTLFGLAALAAAILFCAAVFSHAAPKPGEPPFVKVGSKVAPETVVCLIEAMKLYNEVQAECAGVIVEALVENQQAVEYGQVLFKVDPAG